MPRRVREELYEPLCVEEPAGGGELFLEGGDAFQTLVADHVSYFVATARVSPLGASGGGVRGCVRRLGVALRDGACAPPTLKALVADASCGVARGEVLAILGASGAGKSTLLKVLSGRVSGGVVAGAVSLDGVAFPAGSARFRRTVAYVAQGDGAARRRTRATQLDFNVSECAFGRAPSRAKAAPVEDAPER